MTMGRAEEAPSGDSGDDDTRCAVGGDDTCGGGGASGCGDDGGPEAASSADAEAPSSGRRVRVLFERFVRGERKRALRRLRALGIGRADAEELVQEALLKLWAARAQVAEEAWAGWLRGAIANDAMHARRSYARAEKNEAALTHQVRLDLWTAGLGPEVLLATMEVAADLSRLVDALEPRRRDVARLHFLEGLELAVVADQLGLPADAAKSLWRLARRDLRAAVMQRRARERFRAGGFVSFTFALWLLERSWSRWERWQMGRTMPPSSCHSRARCEHALSSVARARPAAALGLVVVLVAAFVVRHAPGVPLVVSDALAVGERGPDDGGGVVLGAGLAGGTATAALGKSLPVADEAPRVREGAASRVATAPLTSSATPATSAMPAPRATSAMPAPSAAHKVRSIDAGAGEEALIRLAVQAMTHNPARALVLLNEHALRFPGSNVALRTELRRRAASSLPVRGAPAREAREARAGGGPETGRP